LKELANKIYNNSEKDLEANHLQEYK